MFWRVGVIFFYFLHFLTQILGTITFLCEFPLLPNFPGGIIQFQVYSRFSRSPDYHEYQLIQINNERPKYRCIDINSFKQSILLLKKINSPNQATLHLSYLNRCRLETVPDNLYIPSVIPYSSITSEHISRIRGISLPVCARCSPRSHPNTRSRRMPCCSRSSLLGRALKKNRRKVMNFPLRFEIGLERRWAINLSSISFSPMISTQWDGKKPTWERDINRFDGLFISRGIVWYMLTKITKFA